MRLWVSDVKELKDEAAKHRKHDFDRREYLTDQRKTWSYSNDFDICDKILHTWLKILMIECDRRFDYINNDEILIADLILIYLT